MTLTWIISNKFASEWEGERACVVRREQHSPAEHIGYKSRFVADL